MVSAVKKAEEDDGYIIRLYNGKDHKDLDDKIKFNFDIKEAYYTNLKEEKTEELKSVMYHLVENLRRIAILINPYMKHTSEKMLNQLNIPEELRTWDSLADYDKLVNIKVTDKPEVLFARLETEPEIEVIKEMMK